MPLEALLAREDLPDDVREALWRQLAKERDLRARLEVSEQRYQRLCGAVSDYIYTVRLQDGQPVETTHGDACLAVTGYTAAELAADPHLWLRMVPEADREVVLEQARRVQTGRELGPLEHRIIRKDGQVCWVKNTPVLHYDAAGRLVSIQGLVQDITERRGTEEELRAAQRFLESMLDAQRDTVFVFDLATGRPIRWNRAFRIISGYSDAEIAAMKAPEAWYDEDDLRRAARATQSLLTSGAATVELSLITKSGKRVPFEYVGTLLDDGKGARLVVSIGRDCTQRQRAEEELRQRREQIEAIVEASRDWIWATDANGVHSYSNGAVEAILGWRPEELVGASSLELMHEEDRRAVERLLPAAVAEKRGWSDLLIRWRHRDGSWRYLESNAVPILSPSGELLGFRGVDRDITQRRWAEAALRESESHLKQAEAMAHLGYWKVDLRTQELTGSDELSRIFGLSRDQTTLAALEGLIHPDDRELAECQLQGGTEPGKPWDIELRLVLQDGTGKVVHAKGEAVTESSGQVRLLVGTVQDISERKRLEAQLRESEKMATMGEIVAAVAHEVRNPLFALSATLDAFEARAHDQETYAPYRGRLRAQIDRVSELMEDLLTYGRPFSTELTSGSLVPLLDEAVETCSPLAAEREVELERAWPEDLPAVSQDRRRLLRVFVNVIKNAIEHSSRSGAVHIEAREQMRDGNPWIECWVRDWGSGFPEDGLTKVFEPFYSRRRGGTGLGLAIAWRIVKEHNGTITAGNAADGGAVVRVSLPISREAGSPSGQSRSGG